MISSRSVPPISFAPRLCTTIGALAGGVVAEQRLLREPARVDEAVPLQRVELLAGLRDDALLDDLREREIEVVAAEQQVIADRGAREAVAVGVDVDQREVGRAAADVEHQHALAGLRAAAFAPSPRRRSTRRTPPAAPRAARPADSPRFAAACSVSSRAASSNDRRHGDQHFLLGERRVGRARDPTPSRMCAEDLRPARRPATASARRSRPTAGSPRWRSTPG